VTTLTGVAAIVTGAGHGMGRVHALEMSRRGARVAAVDIDGDAARCTADAVRAAGGSALAITVDVADRAAVEAAVAEAVQALGGLDAVVSNAGTIHSDAGLADTDDEDWARTFAVHVGGARNLVRAALPALERSPSPRVVVISSMWAQRGPGFGHAYCAAKGALLSLARNLAVELGPRRICVNAVAPGSVPTRMAADYDAAAIAEDCRSIPLGRWAEAEEISSLVCFLASPESGYMTGQTLAINGGQVIA